MDFSLSRAPADQLQVGTRPYLDPFLAPQYGRKRWDLAGDRFAAAMVLHEMAAGTLPYWGSRNTDPRFTDAEVTVDRDAFPREIAGTARRRSSSARYDATRQQRFDTADDMERAWKRIFEALDQPRRGADSASRRARDALEGNTQTRQSSRSASAPARLTRWIDEGVLTVADFLALPPLAINSMRGVGVETRRELVDAQRDLRRRLGERRRPTTTTTTESRRRRAPGHRSSRG